MKVIVTGGAGYIGSHTVRKLLEKGFDVVIIDNLSRGHIESVPDGVCFENASLLDSRKISEILKNHKAKAIVHFAAFTYVGESVDNPGMYYENNVIGSVNLINAARKSGIKDFVFSSTCSVYGNPVATPISENHPLAPINTYARTKLIIENILEDFRVSHGFEYISLRYFNAAGCSDDASIGESHDPETHLIPLVLYTALGKRDRVSIFGTDYPTEDGTCIRDYIHVNDLADAHVKALQYLGSERNSDVINLGTGKGYSVKEIIDTVQSITGRNVNSLAAPRRQGDPAVLVADNRKAESLLGWKPAYNLESIISSAWNWHKNQKF